ARELAFIIYMRVRGDTAARRLGGAARRLGGSAARPMLGENPLKTLNELLKKREALYLRADAVVDNEGTVGDAVSQIRERMSL
ncbi:MAG TPA: hypothetical protein VFS94_09860, partial [Gemmatimonadales bacterium]|nr:hypothetical protein [Gemmatimonadales bacterium]